MQIAPIASLLGGNQSALNPQGPAASEIAALSWLLFAGAAVIFVAVIALVVYAMVARRAPPCVDGAHRVHRCGRHRVSARRADRRCCFARSCRPRDADGAPDPRCCASKSSASSGGGASTISNANGGHDFATANEIRIPAGRPVELSLRSADVIHSFWVPNLAAKLDMIPGRVNRLRLAADRPGEFRGQCAEYCGGPHARMAFTSSPCVPTNSRRGTRSSSDRRCARPRRRRSAGECLFRARGCGVCHTVRGTRGAGRARSGPHARRQPDLARRGHAAQRRRRARRLDRREPAPEAGQPDAFVRHACRPRRSAPSPRIWKACGDRASRSSSPMSLGRLKARDVSLPNPLPRPRARARRAAPRVAHADGLAPADGRQQHLHRRVLRRDRASVLRAGRHSRAGHAHPARRARQHARRARRSTTSSSRCTAR